jgi:hypothetical protein
MKLLLPDRDRNPVATNVLMTAAQVSASSVHKRRA